MTYTGQSGVDFDRSGRISMFEVLQRIGETTGGLLSEDDFLPSPCAHPLCYQIAYLLIDEQGGTAIPFTQLLDRLQVVWEHGDQGALVHAIETMFGLSEQARALMSMEIEAGRGNYGPCFRFLAERAES